MRGTFQKWGCSLLVGDGQDWSNRSSSGEPLRYPGKCPNGRESSDAGNRGDAQGRSTTVSKDPCPWSESWRLAEL